MNNRKKLIVSYAPFWHNGSSITERSYHIMLAALVALLPGIFQYGIPALGVVSLSVSSAIFWELLINRVRKLPPTIGDGNAALIGMILAMLLPATTPWWAVIIGTFLAIVIGKEIFGGIGGSAFNPVAVSMAMLLVSWKSILNFDQALLNYDFVFKTIYPLGALKAFGVSAVKDISLIDLLIGNQIGGIGATFGVGIIIGGMYLIIRGFIRWEICLSFLTGIFITALLFNLADPIRFAGPGFHLLTGYTLIGAFFLAPEDSSSPVNFIPMLLYGVGGGIMTVLIRNIGAYIDGTILAILVMNLVSPVLDKIRPKAIGKVV
jgi:electron transport complex protein RnfD